MKRNESPSLCSCGCGRPGRTQSVVRWCPEYSCEATVSSFQCDECWVAFLRRNAETPEPKPGGRESAADKRRRLGWPDLSEEQRQANQDEAIDEFTDQ